VFTKAMYTIEFINITGKSNYIFGKEERTTPKYNDNKNEQAQEECCELTKIRKQIHIF